MKNLSSERTSSAQNVVTAMESGVTMEDGKTVPLR